MNEIKLAKDIIDKAVLCFKMGAVPYPMVVIDKLEYSKYNIDILPYNK